MHGEGDRTGGKGQKSDGHRHNARGWDVTDRAGAKVQGNARPAFSRTPDEPPEFPQSGWAHSDCLAKSNLFQVKAAVDFVACDMRSRPRPVGIMAMLSQNCLGTWGTGITSAKWARHGERAAFDDRSRRRLDGP